MLTLLLHCYSRVSRSKFVSEIVVYIAFIPSVEPRGLRVYKSFQSISQPKHLPKMTVVSRTKTENPHIRPHNYLSLPAVSAPPPRPTNTRNSLRNHNTL